MMSCWDAFPAAASGLGSNSFLPAFEFITLFLTLF
jgi:hypothetical protein